MANKRLDAQPHSVQRAARALTMPFGPSDRELRRGDLRRHIGLNICPELITRLAVAETQIVL